ncbi:MAG: hypothetical protein ACKO8K_04925, partial [Candidatus Limnocylindrus sp.]
MIFRFGNLIFEPIWHRRYIDHIQITVAETIGVEGRGAFYEETGALRDILQNHLLQLLTLVAMEPPATLEAEALRDEKVKVLRAVRLLSTDAVDQHVVRGQYGPGWIGATEVAGYRSEPEVEVASETETFVAAPDQRLQQASARRNTEPLGPENIDARDAGAVVSRTSGHALRLSVCLGRPAHGAAANKPIIVPIGQLGP